MEDRGFYIGSDIDNTYAVTDYTGDASSIVIPATYEGLPVTGIGNYAFDRCSRLTSVVIPDSVTSIGSSAFYQCSSLTSITFNGTVAQWNAISKGTNWDYDTPEDKVINFNYKG